MFGSASNKSTPVESSAPISLTDAVGTLQTLRRERAKEYKAILKLEETLHLVQQLEQESKKVEQLKAEFKADVNAAAQEHADGLAALEEQHKRAVGKATEQHTLQLQRLEQATDNARLNYEQERARVNHAVNEFAKNEQAAKKRLDEVMAAERAAQAEHIDASNLRQAEMAQLQATVMALKAQLGKITESLHASADA